MKASELSLKLLLSLIDLAPVVNVYEAIWSSLLELFLCGSQSLVKLIVRILVGHD